MWKIFFFTKLRVSPVSTPGGTRGRCWLGVRYLIGYIRSIVGGDQTKNLDGTNCPTLHRMMITTFDSQHVFHNYAQTELVVSAHSENITFGHNRVLPADRHDPTTPCYQTDAPRHPFDRNSRWLLCCTCTASNFLIRGMYGSR